MPGLTVGCSRRPSAETRIAVTTNFTRGSRQRADLPADADLVLELQLTAPNGPTNGSKVNGASNPVPMLRMVVYDRKTHFVLWAFTQSIEIAFLQKTHDRNFDEALSAILLEFEELSGKAAH